MANIRVDVGYAIHDGSELKFRSPVDCSAITGLIVYYPGEDGNLTSKVFTLADAHGNNVGDIDHLFAENVVVKVILDVTTGMAFVQNADTNAYLEGHIQNKENPHGVTASQVGARPNTWLPTIAEIGAAPAGFGLGETVKWIHAPETLADYIHNGFYSWSSGVTDAPFYAGSMIVIKRSEQYVYQIAFRDDITRVEMAVRKLTVSTWTPWEWINPPMALGEEYRTTERYNGKPVYAQRIDFGAMPNTSSKMVFFTSSSNIDRVLSVTGSSSIGDTIPYKSDVSDISICVAKGVTSTQNYVLIKTSNDQSARTAEAVVKYTLI